MVHWILHWAGCLVSESTNAAGGCSKAHAAGTQGRTVLRERSQAWAGADLEATAKVSYAPSKSISRAALNLFSLP